ncbi:MAG: dephospho-CoA kinase [Eubacterium sp.]|jgi:dephospho-CoA kinase|nr:dephospho-CoA kinase [Lachnospiraceae bacterium]
MIRFIGITGGVGAGKSEILRHLEKHYNCMVMLTDEIAHRLMEPGTACYNQLEEVFADDRVYEPDGRFDRLALAKVLFEHREKRRQLNGIVHPAVKQYVMDAAAEARENKELDFVIVESALLIEEHYDEICDELWYIFTSEEIRRERLKISRGYSDEKVDGIFAAQLTEEEFRRECKVIIDNNGTVEESICQIDRVLSEYGYRKYGIM